jgi:hypothetical protein
MLTKLKMAREVSKDEKLTPQARQMIQIIQDGPADGVAREYLVSELTKVVKTRQPVERIVAFYAQTLGPKGSGLLAVEKTTTAAPKKAKAATLNPPLNVTP